MFKGGIKNWFCLVGGNNRFFVAQHHAAARGSQVGEEQHGVSPSRQGRSLMTSTKLKSESYQQK
jgi:hypothetical protein